jgi:NitT/TauT family transport system ATP-binding protein
MATGGDLMKQDTAIRFDGVDMKYMTRHGETEALKDLTFDVKDGSFITLVGPSGCGKTTLLSLIAGLYQPTEGSVEIYGTPVKGTSHEIGYMLQQDYLLSWRNILDNVALGLELRGMKSHQTLAHARYLLKEMGLSHTETQYPHQLSGGMRQRVALVRTMATDPSIFLLDEPFSALDYQTKLNLEDLVWETLKRHGKTAVLVTHDLSEAIAMSDRIILLGRNPGRVKQVYDVPANIRDQIPFKAREAHGFGQLFHEIWKEMELIETY